ncbi:MAG: glycosyltransferase family 4 protein [Armatimonadota bacterium]|nr:glycosyltransferase family 4 protein [Armatimonadota bacterium]
MDPGISAEGTKGASVHVREMIAAFHSLGHEVILYSPRSGSLIDLVHGETAAEREIMQRRANDQLGEGLDRNGPVDCVYERHSLFSHVGMEWAKSHGVPGVLEVNSPLIDEQSRHRVLINYSAARDSAVRSFIAASKILIVSSGLIGYLFEHCANPNFVVCPNGISPERFPENIEATLPDGRFTIGFLGTLKAWHGIEILLEAFVAAKSKEPSIRLLVVGDGPMANLLEDVEGVEMTGAVDPLAVPGLLGSMDVGVAPYPKQEPFYFSPLKIVEYMAAGLSVIASRIGDIPRIVTHNENGILVDPGDATAIADSILNLMGNRALCSRLGENARRKVMAEFTWTSVAEKALNVEVAA